jgi:hypothetical protein
VSRERKMDDGRWKIEDRVIVVVTIGKNYEEN